MWVPRKFKIIRKKKMEVKDVNEEGERLYIYISKVNEKEKKKDQDDRPRLSCS